MSLMHALGLAASCASSKAAGLRGLRSMKNQNSFAALNLANSLIEEATTTSRKASTTNGAAATTSASSAHDSKGGKKGGKLHDPLVWVDLEMTGLDLDKDTIIEIAVIITDGKLQQSIEGPALAIHQPAEVMNNMNDWCKEHHGKSGLTQRVLDSTVTMQQAEDQVLSFVREYIPEPRSAQLAGNSVHVDRMFLSKYMPELTEHLHYRIVDVSTVKELAKRWFPKDYKQAPRKRLEHTALSDIRESIEELRHWKSKIFKQN